MPRSFREILERSNPEPAKLVIAGAAEEKTLLAAAEASREGAVSVLLVGDAGRIEELLHKKDLRRDGFTILDTKEEAEACDIACGETLKNGAFLMKGLVQTGSLIRSILRRRDEMLTGRLISHISLLELPYIPRLLGLSDTSILISPNVEEKAEIIRSAVGFYNRMGVSRPKVGVLAAVETVNEKMPETLDAARLKEMWAAGEFPGCELEGPISLDLAIDPAAAETKGYESAVRGDADILIAPDIASGNLLGKCFNYTPQSLFAGFLLGTAMPVVLTSRASSFENKLLSIRAGAMIHGGGTA